MITKSSYRRPFAVVAVAAAATSLLGACSSSKDKAAAAPTAPASVASSVAPADSEFCGLEQQIVDRFGQVFATADPSDPEAMVPALQSAADDVRDAADRQLEIASDELHDAVATLVAGVKKAAQGDPSDFETDAYHEASVKVDSYCGLPGISD